MKTFRIVADDKIPGLPVLLEPFSDVTFLPTKKFSNEAIKGANVLFVRTPVKCNEKLLAGNSVEYIGTASIGFDHIDQTYCKNHNIAWSNAPGCNKGSVLSYVLAAISTIKPDVNFSDLTIGVVGVGTIGGYVASSCQALGMKVMLNDPIREENEGKGEFVTLREIGEKCDIITFHTPLSKSGKYPSFHLANEEFFAHVKKKPIVINAARGGVVHEEALLKANRQGLIGGMVIDCWENEPNINRELLKLAHVATPHIGGFSRDGKFNGTRMTVASFARHFGIDVDVSLITPPAPEHPVIDASALDGNVICGAVLYTYPIHNETEALKAAPQDFVKQRDHYPLRRDFCGYTIVNTPFAYAEQLKAIGFNVI
ncbi:MAG: 4-phosphoerythronate dehydrogenase [Bacteroidales bacterium]